MKQIKISFNEIIKIFSYQLNGKVMRGNADIEYMCRPILWFNSQWRHWTRNYLQYKKLSLPFMKYLHSCLSNLSDIWDMLFRLLPIFVVRKAADNSDFFIFNNNNWWMWSQWWLWCVSFYLLSLLYIIDLMSSIEYPWFNVFFIGYCFICYLENRNNKENKNIYTCMASTCIWNGTQFFLFPGY